jgi:hypothetical protein
LQSIQNRFSPKRLERAHDEYLIISWAEDLNPQSMSWSMSDAIFFDPKHFDYGKGPISRSGGRFVCNVPRRCPTLPRYLVGGNKVGAPTVVRRPGLLLLWPSRYPISPGFNSGVSGGEYVANLSKDG